MAGEEGMKEQVLASRVVMRHDCLSQTSNKSEELATKASHCHVNRRIDAYRKEKEEDRAVFPHLTDGCISRKMLQSKDSNNYLVSFPTKGDSQFPASSGVQLHHQGLHGILCA